MLGQVEKNLFGDDETTSNDANILFRLIFALPINWVGNKKKMLGRLLVFMNEHNVEHNSFFDVFSGSGVVSLLAAASGKRVISNDLLTLSTTWLIQILSGRYNPLSIDEVLNILKMTKDLTGPPSKVGFLSELYGGALLTKDEVSYLDAYRRVISEMFGSRMLIGNRLNNGKLEPSFIDLDNGGLLFGGDGGNPEKASFAMQMMCVHILQQAFMGGRCYKSQLLAISEKRLKDGRKGLGGNTNAIGNENHLVGLLSPKTCPTRAVCEFLGRREFSSTITNCDAESIVSSGLVDADVAYFDPPYGGYNSDYAWMYRVCEEFLTGQRLEESVELREASVKFKGDDYERDKEFAKKERKGYSDNFAALLESSKRFPNWIVSFNESSYASIADIVDVISSFRNDLIVETVDGYRYNYREKSAKAGSEYVILARSQ